MNRALLLGLLVAIAAYLALFSKMGLQPGAPTSVSKLFAMLPQND